MMTQNYFGTLDYVFMGIYIAVLVGLGLYLKKKASESLDDYIVGGRKIPWWAMGISGMANFLDLTGTAVIVSFLFILGPQGIFIEFRGGAVLVLVFMMLWTGKWHRRSGCLTGAEWSIFRFGDGWGGRFAQLVSVVGVFISTVGMLAYLIVGVGTFLSVFLPFTPMQCAMVMVGVAAVYTMVSGFYGVVYTDIFQAAIILVAVIYISFKAFFAVVGAEEVSALALQVTQNPDWISGLPRWSAHTPQGYEAYQHLILLMSFYLMRTIFAGIGSGGDPKYFGARNDRECGTLTLLWTSLMTFRWPMMIGIAVLGLFVVQGLFPDLSVMEQAVAAIHEQFPTIEKPEWGVLIAGLANTPDQYAPELITRLQELLGTEQWGQKIQLLGYEGIVNPEKILPSVLLMSVGQGLRGILIIALIAASMSTFDSNVNLATGMVVNDLYRKYFRPSASTRELIYASWATVALLVVGGFVFATSLESINDIWGWMMMGLGAGWLVPSFLRLYWWRFNGSGFAIGFSVGIIAAIVQRIYAPGLPEIYQFLFAITVGLVGAVVGTFITRPTDPEVLNTFYLKTRPFGFWGHLKRQLPEAEQEKMSREHFHDLAAVPFALLWQINMFIAPMLLVIHNWPGFIVSGALFLVGGTGLYFIWFRNLPAGNVYEEAS